ELRRELFYSALFDWQLVSDDNTSIQQNEFLYRSILLPDLIVPMEFRCDVLKADSEVLKLRKVGSAQLSEELIKDITEKHDRYYKPQIHYNFTEYKLEFRQTY